MGYIPDAFDKFDPFQKQFVTGLLTDPVTGLPVPFPPAGGDPAKWEIWEIPQADMQELVDGQATYQPFYDEWSDEDKRNDEIVEDHQREHDIYEKLIREFVAQWLRSNDKLDTGDLAGLGLTVPDTEPTAIPAVDFAPDLSFKKVSTGIQIVRIKNPETPDSNAMPPNQKAEVQSFVGDAGLADNDVPFAPLQDSGKHLLKVAHLPAQKGKTAYFRARYKTNTGKTGPWSAVESELVL